MWIILLQAICQLAFIALAIQMQINPPKTRKSKRLHWLLFAAIAAAGLLLTGLQFASDKKKERLAEDTRTELIENKTKLAKVSEDIDANDKRNRRLIVNIASQRLIEALADVASRPPVLVDKPTELDLSAPKSVLDNKRLEKDANSEQTKLQEAEFSQAALKECASLFDSSIATLSSYLSNAANSRGDRLSSTYKGVPAFMKSGPEMKDYAVIEMAKNPSWRATVSFQMSGSGGPSRTVRMKIQVGPTKPPNESSTWDVEYQSVFKRFQSNLRVYERETFSEKFPLSEYKAKSFDLLTVLLAAQHECHPINNRN